MLCNKLWTNCLHKGELSPRWTCTCSGRKGSRNCTWPSHGALCVLHQNDSRLLRKALLSSGNCVCKLSVQGQAGRGCEQPNLVKDVPAHGRSVGLDDLQRFLPTQTILRFYETSNYATSLLWAYAIKIKSLESN